MRLQKFLAHAGVASRRAAEALIRAGRVTVNGKPVREMGTSVDPAVDAVKYDGRRLLLPTIHHYFLLNKPRRVVSTLSDPEGRSTVKDFLPADSGRLYPVGRLDWDAEGVLLFTDDGELANHLAHPRYGIERTYHVKVRGKAGPAVVEKVGKGITLDDGTVRPEGAAILQRGEKSTWFTITLREGKYHEVKRIFASLGHPVQKLRRVSFAGLQVEGLDLGEGRHLMEEEVRRLRRKKR